jgi:putative hydrolase of the HAD superfamily
MRLIKVIAFDLDDTLWATKPTILRAEKKLNEWLKSTVPQLKHTSESMRELRSTITDREPDLKKKITELRRRIIEHALELSKVSSSEATEISHQAIEVFLVARNQVEFFDGSLSTLKHLSTKYMLGALSNGNADIKRIGLENYFSFAFSAEQVGSPKPALDLFHAALKHTDIQPSEMVYVGDDPILDVDAANRAGLHSVWLRSPSKREPGETTADIVIDLIEELPAALESL